MTRNYCISGVTTSGGLGGDRPRVTPSRGCPDESRKYFVAEFIKNTGETITWKAETVEMRTRYKKGRDFY